MALKKVQLDASAFAVDHTVLASVHRYQESESMHIRRLFFTAILAGFASSPMANDAADQRCPKLPANSGFTWTYQRGPDFGVCYAGKAGDSTQVIGVYAGFAPDFRPDKKKMIRQGKIGTDAIQWYRKQTMDKKFKVGAETLYSRGQTINHIWVLAQDEQSLSALLSLSESLDFGDAR
jgi:hypothetical protein